MVAVGRVGGSHRLVGDGSLVEFANRWLDHLEARQFSLGTVRGYAFDVVCLARFFDEVGIEWREVTPMDFFDWLEWQSRPATPTGETVVRLAVKRGAAPATMNRRVAAARGLFEHAVVCGVLDQNPVPAPRRSSGLRGRRQGLLGHVRVRRPAAPARLVRQARPLPESLAAEYVAVFLADLETHRDRAIVLLMLLGGLRAGEVRSLRLADIDVGLRRVKVTGKGSKQRVVPVDRSFFVELTAYLRMERPSGLSTSECFVVLRGPTTGRPMTEDGLRRIFRTHRARSGAIRVRPHRLRHTYGTELAAAGIDLLVLRELMGHAHVETTAAYVHLAPETVAAEWAPRQTGPAMTAVTRTLNAVDPSRDVLGDYERFVDSLDVTQSPRWQRHRAARGFLERYPDLDEWMRRPTNARLADLHRHKAWPLLTWLLVEGRLRADLELLLTKPAGVDLGMWWTDAQGDDVELAIGVAERLGWSTNWARQVIHHTAPVLCLWAGKGLTGLSDADFDAAAVEAERVNVAPSTRNRFAAALRQLCFQAGIVNEPPRDSKPPARTPAEHGAAIAQAEIRREVIRYAETISTTLRPATAQTRIKAIRVLCDWLAENHPDVTQLDHLDRSDHIEPFLAWSRTRPCRGPNGRGQTVGMTAFHHDLVNLRVFFEDIAEWGWPTAPQRRLLFLSDLPQLPEPTPRALTPDLDRALIAAVAGLDDPFARCGLTVLRATGMRAGELLDLELDCIVDFGAHGTWLRVPIGKLGTERMVPLDPQPLALLDGWITNRDPQRSLPHPRTGQPADFVFVERGRRIGAHRLRVGLATAVAAAGLTDRAGQPLHVTLHQLRHTFGTSLVNAGMSLPALMALLGHVTPEMTLRYAKLASPTIRAAYDTAMAKINSRRPIFTIPAGRTTTIPAKVDWLHSEMLKTRLAHGFCSRHPVAGACPYANICEQCENFDPDPDRQDTIAGQLADITTLQRDATQRGWHGEATRHQRVAEALDRHLRHLDLDTHTAPLALTPPPKAG